MAILTFGAMCRYNGGSRLNWGNIDFASDHSSVVITFKIREKNLNFAKGIRLLLQLLIMSFVL